MLQLLNKTLVRAEGQLLVDTVFQNAVAAVKGILSVREVLREEPISTGPLYPIVVVGSRCSRWKYDSHT